MLIIQWSRCNTNEFISFPLLSMQTVPTRTITLGLCINVTCLLHHLNLFIIKIITATHSETNKYIICITSNSSFVGYFHEKNMKKVVL